MNTHTVTPKYKIGQIVEFKYHNEYVKIDKITEIVGRVCWKKNGKSELSIEYKTRTYGDWFTEAEVIRTIADE